MTDTVKRKIPTQDGQFDLLPEKKNAQPKRLVLIVASDIYLNARASCLLFTFPCSEGSEDIHVIITLTLLRIEVCQHIF